MKKNSTEVPAHIYQLLVHQDNCIKQLRAELAAAHARIAALEAAQEWCPASEPPEADESFNNSIWVEGKCKSGSRVWIEKVLYAHDLKKWFNWHDEECNVIEWRDLPPMPTEENKNEM